MIVICPICQTIAYVADNQDFAVCDYCNEVIYVGNNEIHDTEDETPTGVSE